MKSYPLVTCLGMSDLPNVFVFRGEAEWDILHITEVDRERAPAWPHKKLISLVLRRVNIEPGKGGRSWCIWIS